jgi:hypothetical protein
MTAPLLYHFTCHHGMAGIERAKRLIPHEHPLLPELGPVVWLSDISEGAFAPYALGLTSNTLDCDRTEFRYAVPTEDVKPLWHWPEVRRRCERDAARDLEVGGWPRHWWLSPNPIRVRSFA